MKSRKRLLKRSRLYLILDKKTIGRQSPAAVAGKIKDTGINIIQLRDKSGDRAEILKEASLVRKALLKTKILFIINDYLDISKIVDSDGVHLGQRDTSIEIARRILGKGKIIGISCHNLKQALDAQKRGADYIGIGPIFKTPTKPQYKAVGLRLIKEVKNKIRIPFFAIGDINKDNLRKVLLSGVRRIATCREILKSRNPYLSARYLSKALN